MIYKTLTLIALIFSSFISFQSTATEFEKDMRADFVSDEIKIYPFFKNIHTYEPIFLIRDIPLIDLIGYRFEVSKDKSSNGEFINNILNVTVKYNTKLEDLEFGSKFNRDNEIPRLCVFKPDGSILGGRCTDKYYGHTWPPSFSKPQDYFYDDFFLVNYRANFASNEDNNKKIYPYFTNKNTNKSLYLRKDIPMTNLIGCRFIVYKDIHYNTQFTNKILDVTITQNTGLEDLEFGSNFNRDDYITRLCVYRPDGTTVGEQCTDVIFGHTWQPDESNKSDSYYNNDIESKYSPGDYLKNLISNPQPSEDNLAFWFNDYKSRDKRTQTLRLRDYNFSNSFLESEPTFILSFTFNQDSCDEQYLPVVTLLNDRFEEILRWNKNINGSECNHSQEGVFFSVEIPSKSSQAEYVKLSFPDGSIRAGKYKDINLAMKPANLLHNPNELGSWKVLNNGGDGFKVDILPSGETAFRTSYEWDRKRQEIDLIAKGFRPEDLDSGKYPIYLHTSFGSILNPGKYQLTVEFLDSRKQVLYTYDTGEVV